MTNWVQCSLETLTALRFEYYVAVLQAAMQGKFDARILRVAAEGRYRSDQDAWSLFAAIQSGVHAIRPHALVVDFRRLEYSSGDALEIVFDTTARGRRAVFMVSSTCEHALRTLAAPLHPDALFVSTDEQALECVRSLLVGASSGDASG